MNSCKLHSLYIIGGPVTSVSWKFNDNEITNRRIQFIGNSIRIPNVDETYDGLYTCEGQTVHSKTSTFIKLITQCELLF